MIKSELEIIRGAIKALEEHEWSRGAMFRDKRGFAMSGTSYRGCPKDIAGCCAVGALFMGAGDIETAYSDQLTQVIDMVNRLVDTGSIIDFNDRRAKDKEDILRIFRMAEANFVELENKNAEGPD